MTFGEKVIDFYNNLELKLTLPDSISLLNPFTDHAVKKVFREFYTRYYPDPGKRIIIFGINPGRFGAGVTGIPFTDPIRLSSMCGIKNDFKQLPELSSVFIYEMVNAYGGIKKFCADFYLTAVCPLGFVQHGKNLNYYDDKKLQSSLQHFIVSSIKRQLAFGTTNKTCICLGEGKNFAFLKKLNEEQKMFQQIVPLPHPRWIMQYKRTSMNEYLTTFIDTLKKQKRFLAV